MNIYFLGLLYLAFFATLSAFIASLKHRDIQQWFWIGMLLGVFGVIVLLFQPDLKKDSDETKLV